MDEGIRKLAEADLQGLNAAFYKGEIEKLVSDGYEESPDMKRLFEILDGIILDDIRNEFVCPLYKGERLYRARIILPDDYSDVSKGLCYDKERCYGYNSEQSKEPPKELSKNQRNSVEGEQALYIASDEITACCEVKSTVRQRLSIAEFELSEDIEYIDFSKLKYNTSFSQFNSKYGVEVYDLMRYFLGLFSFPVYSKDEYATTQKIVKHFREQGYKGFKYRSFYTSGFNYTFFDELMAKFVHIDSKVYINYAMANLFVSLDKNAMEMDDLTNIDKINSGINDKIREVFWSNTIREFKYKINDNI